MKSGTFVVLAVILLSSILTSSYIIKSAISEPGASLKFTIVNAGIIWHKGDPVTDKVIPGWLTLYDGVTTKGSWKAGSGDNIPANQYVQQDESDNDPWGGPIPSGTWNVRPLGADPNYPNRYPIDKVSYNGPRFGFQIHLGPSVGETHGCIAIESGKYDNFKNTINPYFVNPQTVIPLTVSYGVGGVVVSVDKLGLLAPYIGLTSTIIVVTVATAIYVKRVKHRKEKQ